MGTGGGGGWKGRSRLVNSSTDIFASGLSSIWSSPFWSLVKLRWSGPNCSSDSDMPCAVFSMDWTVEERVKITSSGSFLSSFFEKIASNASEVEVGGTVVVTEMGRWMEKNEAT